MEDHERPPTRYRWRTPPRRRRSRSQSPLSDVSYSSPAEPPVPEVSAEPAPVPLIETEPEIPTFRILTAGNMIEYFYLETGQSVIYIPDRYIETAIGSSTGETWAFTPTFHRTFIERLESCFGHIIYRNNIYIADNTIYIELFRINGTHAAGFTNIYGHESDHAHYAVLSFYRTFGIEYAVEYAGGADCI